jgi:hypothetical protein
MLNREEKLMEKMNELIDYVNTLDIISFLDFQKQVKRILGKKWEKDADDLVYFLDEKIYKLLEKKKNPFIINKYEDGTMKEIKRVEKIKKITSMNRFIIDNFIP